MVDQSHIDAPLFNETPAVCSSPTGRAAAQRVGGKAKQQRERILRFLIECGSAGATDDEIQQHLNIDGNSEWPRRVRLVELGVMYGTKRTRPTWTGSRATVGAAANTARLEAETGANHAG